MVSKLKIERVKRGWTQDKLAEVSGVGRVSISRIERNGINKSPVYTLEKLAKALDMKVSELFFNDEK